MTSLNLQNVQLTIADPAFYRILEANGEQQDSKMPHPKTPRDWRKLRARLIAFSDLDNPRDNEEVAQWLTDAGYVTAEGQAFTALTTTDQIQFWLQDWLGVVCWGMQTDQFRSYARRFWKWENRSHKGTQNARTDKLFLDIGAPESIPIPIWKTFFNGMGTIKELRGSLGVNEQWRPVLKLEAESPMHAIALTIFIDRVFTQQKLAVCKWCRCRFVATRTGQQCCDTAHYDNWKMKIRRTKLRLIEEAIEKAPRKNDWAWVARYATRAMRKRFPKEEAKITTISAAWVRRGGKQMEAK